ncbi:MAG TPA: DUF3109 family protein [Bacteroidales bacterium]|nr:DUF3109 family protein [Bacteroidales bacterium]MCZ2417023.1 DUF3109 family protein [Burkholderiales bacterium]OQC55928.1 MAG: hypothetical protein BWX52_01917 [Bacteroidetes bacterium ADurb.Bin013]MBV6456219.1 hypothetical protein [Bacteroidales bacterium]MCZ2316561.1 DUF3109 family protein [Bacteroidales bacterium]
MIIVSDKILVSENILTEYFTCNPRACQGICCVEGESGAPLEQDECTLLETEWTRFVPFMQKTGVRAIEKQGPWTLDIEGDAVTPLIEGKECAYAFFRDGICRCAIEKAYSEGVSSFRKPVSCWLYPIRVRKLADGVIGLNYHKWYLCGAARELGAKKKTRVFEFLKEPLTHCFGPDVYQAIRQAADNPG